MERILFASMRHAVRPLDVQHPVCPAGIADESMFVVPGLGRKVKASWHGPTFTQIKSNAGDQPLGTATSQMTKARASDRSPGRVG